MATEQNKAEPIKRKSVPVSTVNDEVVRKEVEALFSDKPVPAQAAGNADDFIARTAHTKITIIISLFGYWQDVNDGYFDEHVLEATLDRVRSYAHQAYVLILAEPKRLAPEMAKIINSKFVAGNCKGIEMPIGSSYGDYSRKGMEVALNETDGAYIIFLNPWVVIQEHGIDTLIDRINVPDNAPAICGYDVNKKLMQKNNENFDAAAVEFNKYKANAPDELMMMNFNFFGMSRYIAEMCPLDPVIKTQPYLERDFFQSMGSKGYTAVSSERVPIFGFQFDWGKYVKATDYEDDKAAFLKKWKFLPENITHD